jgi:hypothetical protein
VFLKPGTKAISRSSISTVEHAVVDRDNISLKQVIIEHCKRFLCLLICPLYLSYGSDLVYRENTVRMTRVLNSVAVHFKSAEQIVILTRCILARSLMS